MLAQRSVAKSMQPDLSATPGSAASCRSWLHEIGRPVLLKSRSVRGRAYVRRRPVLVAGSDTMRKRQGPAVVSEVYNAPQDGTGHGMQQRCLLNHLVRLLSLWCIGTGTTTPPAHARSMRILPCFMYPPTNDLASRINQSLAHHT